MAMFGNNNGNKEKTTMNTAELSNSNTIIGKGSTMEGNIETYGNVRIEGRIVGNIKSKSKVVLGDSSVIEGSILAQNAEVAGDMKGSLEVSEVLVLKASAVINGDITCNKLIVETGASFNGSCKMVTVIKEINIDIASTTNGKIKNNNQKQETTI
jgi:cytoskeletal protein CcmA (bactofilin family)